MNRKTAVSKSKIISIVFALLGLFLFVYMVWSTGPTKIIEDIKKLGAGGFLLILAISSLRYIIRTLGWMLCFEGEERLRFRDAFRAYVVGDAMGNLTPLGLAASEPTKAAMVRGRVPLVAAVSALAVQNLFVSLSVILFILSGLVFLMLSFHLTHGLYLTVLISFGSVCLFLVAGIIIYHSRWNFITATFERLRRTRFGKRFLKEKQGENTRAVEDTVYNFYSRHRARCAFIMCMEACFHLAGALEVYVTLSFISPTKPTFLVAYVLESVNRIINVAFTFIPFAMGIDEAGSSWITKRLSYGVETGTTLGIIRKARVICWTALGLAFLVGRGLSRKSVAKETDVVMTEEFGASIYISESN